MDSGSVQPYRWPAHPSCMRQRIRLAGKSPGGAGGASSNAEQPGTANNRESSMDGPRQTAIEARRPILSPGSRIELRRDFGDAELAQAGKRNGPSNSRFGCSCRDPATRGILVTRRLLRTMRSSVWERMYEGREKGWEVEREEGRRRSVAPRSYTVHGGGWPSTANGGRAQTILAVRLGGRDIG